MPMRSLLLALLLSTSIGCGFNTAPVLDIVNSPVVLAHGVSPAEAVTRDAILRALVERKWTIVKEEGTSILATVTAGGHTATVGITYNATSYSIRYVDSSPGLKYDGVEIHRRYNHWVDRLRVSINEHLANAPPAPSAPTAGGEVTAPPVEPPTGPVLPPPADPAPAAAHPQAPAEPMPPAPPPAK
jgi:hypothetical protein